MKAVLPTTTVAASPSGTGLKEFPRSLAVNKQSDAYRAKFDVAMRRSQYAKKVRSSSAHTNGSPLSVELGRSSTATASPVMDTYAPGITKKLVKGQQAYADPQELAPTSAWTSIHKPTAVLAPTLSVTTTPHFHNDTTAARPETRKTLSPASGLMMSPPKRSHSRTAAFTPRLSVLPEEDHVAELLSMLHDGPMFVNDGSVSDVFGNRFGVSPSTIDSARSMTP